MRIASIIMLMLAAVALSGCTVSNSPDGQTAGGPGSVSYNGASAGTQTSTPIECDGSGEVSISYNLGGGSITVVVKDGGGASVWSESYDSPGQGAQTEDVTGAAGDWVLEVTRSSGLYGEFSGQYAGAIEC